MKKNLWILGSLLMGAMLASSCSSDDDDNQETKSYFTVSGATYEEAEFPAATIDETLDGVSVSMSVKAGSTSTIKIEKSDDYRRFFIGVKGAQGYWVYTPQDTRATDDDYWEIPVTYGGGSSSSPVFLVSAEDEDGYITQPYEVTVNYVDESSDTWKCVRWYQKYIYSDYGPDEDEETYDDDWTQWILILNKNGTYKWMTYQYIYEEDVVQELKEEFGGVGTFTKTGRDEYEWVWTISGKWKKNGNKLNLDSYDTFDILEWSDTTLRLSQSFDEDGGAYYNEWTFVKQ